MTHSISAQFGLVQQLFFGKMLEKYKYLIATGLVIICFIGLAMVINTLESHENKKQPVAIEEPIEAEIIAGKDVYLTDNINDESSAVITETSTTVSYWYIYYNAHIKSSDARYTGYEIVELSTPYFDIHSAIIKVIPTYKNDEDFVGIEYFKRVPFETYKSYKDNE